MALYGGIVWLNSIEIDWMFQAQLNEPFAYLHKNKAVFKSNRSVDYSVCVQFADISVKMYFVHLWFAAQNLSLCSIIVQYGISNANIFRHLIYALAIIMHLPSGANRECNEAI